MPLTILQNFETFVKYPVGEGELKFDKHIRLLFSMHCSPDPITNFESTNSDYKFVNKSDRF